jgi:hypothetical protein
MASLVSFADAMGSLKSMFPKFDDAVFRTMLGANGMHMERTIEQLLQMDSAMGDQSGAGGGSENTSAVQATTTSSSYRTANLFEDDGSRDLPMATAIYDTSGRTGDGNSTFLSSNQYLSSQRRMKLITLTVVDHWEWPSKETTSHKIMINPIYIESVDAVSFGVRIVNNGGYYINTEDDLSRCDDVFDANPEWYSDLYGDAIDRDWHKTIRGGCKITMHSNAEGGSRTVFVSESVDTVHRLIQN